MPLMKERTKISPKYMLLLVFGTFIFSIVYYFIGKKFANSPLTYYQYLIFTLTLAVVIVGGYQIFFWVQRNNYFFKTRCFKTRFDDYIPFWPKMVWVYSFCYYTLIGLAVISLQSIEQGVILIFGGLFLLFLQSIFFLLFPSTVPSNWRKYKTDSLSKLHLKFIQGIDNGRNCFPSMHCSLATYVGLILMPFISYYALIIVLLIVVSCLFVKQHQIVDIITGIFLGWVVYSIII